MKKTVVDSNRRAVEKAMRDLLLVAGVDADSRWLELEGRRFHYLEVGRGPAVILIHGAGGGAANWYGILGRLSEGRRVLVPDLPGFGLSGPVEARRPLGMQVADILDAWLQRLGIEKCGVAGTSFGGLVALRMAQRRESRVERLALIDSAGLGREMPMAVRAIGLRVLGPLILRPSRRGTRFALRRFLTAGQPLDPAVEPALVEYLHRSAVASDPSILARAHRVFAGIRGQREWLSDTELVSLCQPTLVVWGRRDAFFPAAHAERASRLIPQVRVRWIEAAGHSPNWEAPGEVAEALDDFFPPFRDES